MSAGHYSSLYEAEHFYVAESTIPGAGLGLFAKHDIPMQAHPVLEYSGSRLRVYLNSHRPRRQRAPLSLEYLMEVSPADGKGLGPCLVDASDPHRSGLAWYINSPWRAFSAEGTKCKANAQFRRASGQVLVFLLRDVQAGEEILAYYTPEGERSGVLCARLPEGVF